MANYNFTVRAEDERGAYADRTFSIQVQNNLVDRYLKVNLQHAHSSIDGINWTLRDGKGGIACAFIAGKWVIFKEGMTYRLSDDTINWEEGYKFETTDKSSVVSNRGLKFLTPIRRLFEHNGSVYAIGKVYGSNERYDNKIAVFRSNDLIEWEVIEGSLNLGYESLVGDMGGISNIALHRGEFLVYVAEKGEFSLTSNFSSFTRKKIVGFENHPLKDITDLSKRYINQATVVNSATGSNENFSIATILSTNGVVGLYVAGSNIAKNSSTMAEYRQEYAYYTTDLMNLSTPKTSGSLLQAASVGAPTATTGYFVGSATNSAYSTLGRFSGVTREYLKMAMQTALPFYYNGYYIVGLYYAKTISFLTPTEITATAISSTTQSIATTYTTTENAALQQQYGVFMRHSITSNMKGFILQTIPHSTMGSSFRANLNNLNVPSYNAISARFDKSTSLQWSTINGAGRF